MFSMDNIKYYIQGIRTHDILSPKMGKSENFRDLINGAQEYEAR